MDEAHDTPSEVTRVDGVVIVDGPDGVATTMTPKAALETAQRLTDQAIEALVANDTAPADEDAEKDAGEA
jgi:predicted phosphoribosyltransferase